MHGIELRSLFLLFTEITACHLSAGSSSFIISFSTDYYEILPVMLTDVLAGQYVLNEIFLLNWDGIKLYIGLLNIICISAAKIPKRYWKSSIWNQIPLKRYQHPQKIRIEINDSLLGWIIKYRSTYSLVIWAWDCFSKARILSSSFRSILYLTSCEPRQRQLTLSTVSLHYSCINRLQLLSNCHCL